MPRISSSDEIHRETDFWTILCLTPRSTPKHEDRWDSFGIDDHRNFWIVTLCTACGFISEASAPWRIVAENLEDIPSLGQDLHATIEDDKFSQ